MYTDIMVDLETTGCEPDRNGILQIGAVKFNRLTREINTDFYMACPSLPNFRSWDMETASWWARQPPQIMQNIRENERPYQEVMQEFQQWVLKDMQPKTPIRFWSKPTHFDYMFIASSLKDCGLVNPFSYREATDMNSFIRGMYHPNPVPEEIEKSVTHSGAAHDALNDCFYQLKVLFAHEDNLKDAS